jgi:hypothetical protein
MKKGMIIYKKSILLDRAGATIIPGDAKFEYKTVFDEGGIVRPCPYINISAPPSKEDPQTPVVTPAPTSPTPVSAGGVVA